MAQESESGLTSIGTEVKDDDGYRATYPRDEFDVDVVPGQRRGAHRVAAPPVVAALPWILIGLFVLACIIALVTVTGGFGLGRPSESTATASPAATATASATPTETVPVADDVDKGVQLLVLNGTRTRSTTDTAAKKLRDAGWIVANTGSNDDRNVETTFVVYKDDSLKATAQALADFLGGGTIQVDPALPEDMRVVLGDNYGS